MMDADLVGDSALYDGNNRAPHDAHNEQSGTLSRQRTEARNTQGENAREHNGIEETHQDDGPHGNRTEAQHGGDD